jgi:uncharacterized repeat protein (TIGR03803 family)
MSPTFMRLLVAIVCSAFLASCARGTISSPLPPPAAVLPDANGYALLYSFKSGEDAGYPYDSLTPLGGALYGTTYGGGGGYEWGTIFKVSTTGEEHVLYRFKAGNDGAHPYAGLIVVNGTLYGTTYQGGTSGAGTVFSVSASGVEHVLYSFKGANDGQYPYARLLDLNGTLYGTTYEGGVYPGWGVVFRISTSGEEHVIYRFKAGKDGAHPFAGLIAVNGMLYGTTYQGGASGSGSVYKVSTSGVERVIYSFKGGKDGQYPYARLLDVKGTLYGTTYQGGVSPGWGVIFKVSTSGVEDVLYRFKASSDGAHPYFAGLIEQNGTLYGTTYQGGAKGAGTVYSEIPSGGDDRVLYSFKAGTDGAYPYAGLIALNGAAYGTTYQGGASNAGTIFKLSL